MGLSDFRDMISTSDDKWRKLLVPDSRFINLMKKEYAIITGSTHVTV
jgi:hypothetical protein